MSLYEGRIINAITTAVQQQQQQPRTSADELDTDYGTGVSTDLQRLKKEADRQSAIEVSRKMYYGDGRYEGIVNTLARDVTAMPFQVEFGTPNAQAIELVEETRSNVKIDDRLYDWARETFRDGDTFLELAVDLDRVLRGASRKPTLKMHRNSNSQDGFDDAKMAYWLSKQTPLGVPTAKEKAIWFAQWQIVHARWNHDEGKKYGRPLMSSGELAYSRVKEGEKDLAVRRKTRAGIRNYHFVKGDSSAIERYRKINKRALNSPTASVLDFFGNTPDGVKTIQGDGNLGNIADVLHHLDTWWIGSPVPKAILGYGRDLNRDVLREQKAQYDESLTAVRAWVCADLIKPILELQWLLAGIVPESLEYEIVIPAKSYATPEEITSITTAATALRNLGVGNDVITQIMAMFLPNVDQQMLLDSMGAASPNDTPDAGRMDQISQRLSQLLGEPEPEADGDGDAAVAAEALRKLNPQAAKALGALLG